MDTKYIFIYTLIVICTLIDNFVKTDMWLKKKILLSVYCVKLKLFISFMDNIWRSSVRKDIKWSDVWLWIFCVVLIKTGLLEVYISVKRK